MPLQRADEPGQANDEGVTFGWGQCVEQLHMAGPQFTAQLLGHGETRFGQPQLVETAVGWCALASDPFASLQPGAQPTDGLYFPEMMYLDLYLGAW